MLDSIQSAPSATIHGVQARAQQPRPRRGKAQALDLANLTERQALPITFRELAELYSAAHADQEVPMLVMGKWLDTFRLGDVPAWDLKREQLVAGYEAMIDDFGYAVSAANRNLSQIGMLYRWAIAQKMTPAAFVSPTIGIRRQPEVARVVEPARPGEWEHMRRVARGFGDPRFTLLVHLLMDTGARRGEINARRWADFDLDAPEGPSIVLTAEQTKTGRARRLYFSPETAALARRLRPAEKYRDQLAFVSKRAVNTPNQYRKPWARMAELIGRPGMRMYDIRHMVAAELLKAGKGMSQVSQLLGHSSLVLHTRYGHLDDASIRDLQADRLELDKAPAPMFAPVAEAKARHEQRQRSATDDAMAEAQRLQLVAQEAMAAAMAAAQALAGMRIQPATVPAL